jgi:hypothetical protein
MIAFTSEDQLRAEKKPVVKGSLSRVWARQNQQVGSALEQPNLHFSSSVLVDIGEALSRERR